MIQFNLLPDVKLQFIKARRLKQVTILIAGLAAAASLFVLVLLLLVVDVFQKKHLTDVNKDIKSYSQKLESTPNLNKILTVQNQLNSIPGLQDQKPVVSRLFGYIGQVVPAQVTISAINVDFDQHTMTLSGGANSIATINTFVDTLKFTTYSTTDGSVSATNAFSGVVLTSYAISSGTSSTYSITLNFQPDIFDSSKDAKLNVPPNKITTRSEVEDPTNLFNTSPSPSSTNQTTQ